MASHTRRANTPNRKITDRMAVIKKISNYKYWQAAGLRGNPYALQMRMQTTQSLVTGRVSIAVSPNLLYDKL